MKRLSCIAGSIALLMAASMQAYAVVDEITAAYCSGGGVGVIEPDGLLGPPGLSDDTKASFARPVLATGAVALAFDTPAPGDLDITIGNSRAAKYPAGTHVITLLDGGGVAGPRAATLGSPPGAERLASSCVRLLAARRLGDGAGRVAKPR